MGEGMTGWAAYRRVRHTTGRMAESTLVCLLLARLLTIGGTHCPSADNYQTKNPTELGSAAKKWKDKGKALQLVLQATRKIGNLQLPMLERAHAHMHSCVRACVQKLRFKVT
eukprot:1160938-Pelagomonas_calceolata.AAC.25